jgi:hypothetical protein
MFVWVHCLWACRRQSILLGGSGGTKLMGRGTGWEKEDCKVSDGCMLGSWGNKSTEKDVSCFHCWLSLSRDHLPKREGATIACPRVGLKESIINWLPLHLGLSLHGQSPPRVWATSYLPPLFIPWSSDTKFRQHSQIPHIRRGVSQSTEALPRQDTQTCDEFLSLQSLC